MPRSRPYAGLNNDVDGGMTPFGRVIRDAWVFGVIPETETCENWDFSRISALVEQVNNEWDKYGCLVSQLPEDLFKRHQEIHGAAIEKARASGWTGELETEDDT